MEDKDPTSGGATAGGAVDYTDKQVVRNLQLSLENIVNVSEAAFAKISHLKEKELLLAFGNTGCGKSTMISSLVFGPDKLEMKAVPEKKMVRGVEKTYYNKIIDQREDFKGWLAGQNFDGLFEIGHSKAESKTFIPHFYKPPDQNMIYSDIAGLMDTAGDLIEYVNCFMNKKIFNQAKKIKFIVPITKAQMKEVRGGPIVQQIEIILNLCSRSYSDVIKSIQPVITKVEQHPSPEEVYDDDDIDVLKYNLKEIFDNYLINTRREMAEELDQGKSSDGVPTGSLEDRQKMEDQLKELEKFLFEFSSKAVIFDPLDRPIPTPPQMELFEIPEPWSTTRDDLLAKIIDLQGTQGIYLNVPLSNKLHQKLMKMLDRSRDLCLEEANNYIVQAKEEGVAFNMQIKDNEQIKAYERQLKFFSDHNLVRDIKKRHAKFQNEIRTFQDLIEKEKVHSERSALDKLILQLFKDMNDMRIQENYVKLVEKMASSQDQIDSLEQRQSTEFNNQINALKTDLRNCLEDVYNDPKAFAYFAFELRVLDAKKATENNSQLNKTDYYTKKILDYKVITSPIWEDILYSNHWIDNPPPPGEQMPKMIVDEKVQFKLNLAETVFRCEDKNFIKEIGVTEKPLVASYPDEELFNKMKDKGFFSRFKAMISSENKSEFLNTWRKLSKSYYNMGTDTVQFELTKHGLQIGKNYKTNQMEDGKQVMRNTKLCTKKNVEQGSYSMILWVDKLYNMWSDPQCSHFVLQPVEDQPNQFTIEIPWGDIKPRLCAYSDDFSISSSVICSATSRETDRQSIWTITKVTQDANNQSVASNGASASTVAETVK